MGFLSSDLIKFFSTLIFKSLVMQRRPWLLWLPKGVGIHMPVYVADAVYMKHICWGYQLAVGGYVFIGNWPIYVSCSPSRGVSVYILIL